MESSFVIKKSGDFLLYSLPGISSMEVYLLSPEAPNPVQLGAIYRYRGEGYKAIFCPAKNPEYPKVPDKLSEAVDTIQEACEILRQSYHDWLEQMLTELLEIQS